MKLSSKDEVTRHKVRLVAKEFLQREGVDFDEICAPVVMIKTIRKLFPYPISTISP